MFKKLSIAIATAVTMSVMTTGAFAGVIHTFKWYDPGTPGNGGNTNVGTTKVFTSDNGLNVTASFWTGKNTSDGSGGSAANGYWGHGLGVIGSGSNSLDYHSGEGILFDFGTDVVAISSLVWHYPRESGAAADASVWVDGVQIHNGTDVYGLKTLNLDGAEGSQILFMNVDGGQYNNALRVKSLVVEYTEKEVSVPEPGALALMGLGIIGIGAAARRRKAA